MLKGSASAALKRCSTQRRNASRQILHFQCFEVSRFQCFEVSKFRVSSFKVSSFESKPHRHFGRAGQGTPGARGQAWSGAGSGRRRCQASLYFAYLDLGRCGARSISDWCSRTRGRCVSGTSVLEGKSNSPPCRDKERRDKDGATPVNSGSPFDVFPSVSCSGQALDCEDRPRADDLLRSR